MIFDHYAEVDEETEEKMITLIAFKKMCREYKIYSVESQKKFLERRGKYFLAKDAKDLVSKWREIYCPKLEIM